MIHQCYFEEAQRGGLFPSQLYRGFGLYTAVNPDIARNCPELEDPRNQPLLSEYGALLHLWRNPSLDPDPWLGFTSYRQLDKFPTVLQDRQAVAEGLARYDILGWGFYTFLDVQSKRPVTLAEQGERCHPGITSALWRLLHLNNETMPDHYLRGHSGLYCNYWLMSRENFGAYMSWSYPKVRWTLDHPDAFCASHPRSLSFLVERLFILWYLLKGKSLCNIGTMVHGLCGNPWGPTQSPGSAAAGPEESFIVLQAWNATLAELSLRHRATPCGILHIGAHHAEERDIYRLMGVPQVLWVEADPANMDQLRANVAGYPGQRAVQACLTDVDGQATPFHRTNNQGQSSSILPLGTHRQHFEHIHVVEHTQLQTMTFLTLLEREGLSLAAYDFLVLDVQGAELLVLKGFGDALHQLNGAFVEVNLEALYEGCALLPEIDAYLARFGLVRRETLITSRKYGDALYLRPGVYEEPPRNLPQRLQAARTRLLGTRCFLVRQGHQPEVPVELLEDGRVTGNGRPLEYQWFVRAAGHEILLELAGRPGRTCCLRQEGDTLWRGMTTLPPHVAVEAIPAAVSGKCSLTA
jgi:FkbM family methyltransferase